LDLIGIFTEFKTSSENRHFNHACQQENEIHYQFANWAGQPIVSGEACFTEPALFDNQNT
jgi:hypothetical protein